METNQTNQIKVYTNEESCANGIRGWYYTEPQFPCGEAEFYRWI
jgi:hypothetical protein